MTQSYKLCIDGLDDKMEEGIPEKHIILLTGTPGTMKSSIAYNCLFRNATENNIPGLYLTLEQDKNSFLYHLNKMGMGEPGNNLRIFDMGIIREQWLKLSDKEDEPSTSEGLREKDLDTFKRQIETLKKTFYYKLLVIDSLPIVEMMFGMQNPRDELFYFFRWLKRLGVTTVLISEMTQDSPKYSKHDIDFLADGIIKVSMIQKDPTTTQRQIQVVKMRGVDHTTNPFTLEFKNGTFDAVKVLI